MNENIDSIKNLSEYFIKSAEKSPNRNALVVDEQAISYHDLLQRVSRLAYYLSHCEGQQCALFSARGVNSYVGLLATLMAGKTYVPISIKSPKERNLQILKYSDAKILIVDEKCIQDAVSLLQDVNDPLCVIIPSSDQLSDEVQLVNHNFIDANNLKNLPLLNDALMQEDAYLLFTSGSTGTPKAVMTSHASAIEYISKMTVLYQPTELDRFSQLTDLSFDVAMHELFLCWANGACLYAITDHQLASLHRFIGQHQLTFWNSVPSVISLLKQWNRLSPGLFPSIRYSTFMGEPLIEELAHAWHLAAPHSQIDNLYGPTEATITCTGHRWQPGHAHPSGYVPIGKPFKGQYVAILDENRKPVPNGTVGELYLAGSQVAKEYWKSPMLTEEKFIELHDIEKGQAKCWYKTGDFVYWDESFGLVFKGRDNDLLKVRGGRIERLEVEMALRNIAKTSAVAVVPLQASKDGVVLGTMAFIGCSSIDDSTILKDCRRKLPEYMVPSKLIRVDSLPYTKNGKVDYQFLTQRAYALSPIFC